jgi:GTP-binding protein HflX
LNERGHLTKVDIFGLLVAVETDEHIDSIEVRLLELEELANTAGITVVGTLEQRKRRFDPATLVGQGKVQEIVDAVSLHSPGIVVFDNELTPTQQRNLGEALKCRVIDRTQLILDIFAQRARTREGKLQVELAQMSYLLPRLSMLYTKFERQQGGIGVRGGGGETKLELDRRKVRERIIELQRELEDVKKKRRLQRKGRKDLPFPTATLVGYTSAGKSTILNSLSDAAVLADKMLFSTLDPTTRRVNLPDGRGILLTDTVGFIRNLPHDLVAAFRATLEEVNDADMLLHIVDASSDEADRHRDTVLETLENLGASNKPIITVFNKRDAVEDLDALDGLMPTIPNSCSISAKTGDGMDTFMDAIADVLKSLVRTLTVLLPYERSDLLAKCHAHGIVHALEYVEKGVHITVDLPEALFVELSPFDVTPKEQPFWLVESEKPELEE